MTLSCPVINGVSSSMQAGVRGVASLDELEQLAPSTECTAAAGSG
jgi:hypothetical protein